MSSFILDDDYTQTDSSERNLPISRHLWNTFESLERWARLCAILGMVWSVLLIVVTVFVLQSGVFESSLYGLMQNYSPLQYTLLRNMKMVLLLGTTGFLGLSVWQLLFALALKKALVRQDQRLLQKAWRQQLMYYRLYGILAIILVVLYVIDRIMFFWFVAG